MTSSGHIQLDRQCNVARREIACNGAENFGEVSCMECTGRGNDFELIPTAKMETRYPIGGSFGDDEFPSLYNHSRVMAA